MWPSLEGAQSTKALVELLRADGLSTEVAGSYRVADVSLDFYLGRSIARENEAAALAREVAQAPGRLWVIPTAELGAISRDLPLTEEPILTVSRRSVVRLSPTRAPRAGGLP